MLDYFESPYKDRSTKLCVCLLKLKTNAFHWSISCVLLCRFRHIPSFACSDLLKHDETLHIIALIERSRSNILCQ